MATVFEICEKVKSGEVVAIPADYMGSFMLEVEKHNIGEARFKIVMNGDKCLIGPSELECQGWQIANQQRPKTER